MQTIFFGLTTPQARLSPQFGKQMGMPRTNHLPPTSVKDVVSIRFAGEQTIEAQAAAFSQKWDKALRMPNVAAAQAFFDALAQEPDATVEKFHKRKQEALLAGLDKKAYQELQYLLAHASEIKDGKVLAHLERLEAQGLIRPNTESNIQAAKDQAELEARGLKLYRWDHEIRELYSPNLQRDMYPSEDAFEQAKAESERLWWEEGSPKYKAYQRAMRDWITERNLMIKNPNAADFYEETLLRQGLTGEQIAEECEQVLSAMEEKVDKLSWLDNAISEARRNGNEALLRDLKTLEASKAATAEKRDEDLESLFRIGFDDAVQAARRMAGMIGQSERFENVLAQSQLRLDPFSSREVGPFCLPIDAPDVIRSTDRWPADFPGEADEGNRAQVTQLLRTTIGYGVGSSLIDKNLPYALRAFDFTDNGLVTEALAFQIGLQLYDPKTLKAVLDLKNKPEDMEKLERLKAFLPGGKLNEIWGTLDYAGQFRTEQEVYKMVGRTLDQKDPFYSMYQQTNEQEGSLSHSTISPEWTVVPAYEHNHFYAVAWGAQLDAAMKKKYPNGGLMSKEAWKEIEAVLSKGHMLNWKEQIKILSSPTQEIKNVLPLVGTPKGKAAIQRMSGPDFSFDALFAEIDTLVEKADKV